MPQIYLLIFWAKARRSAMAAKAAAAVWARTGRRARASSLALPPSPPPPVPAPDPGGWGWRPEPGTSPAVMLLRGAQLETAPPSSASIPAGAGSSERSSGPREPRERMGRGGIQPPAVTARLPRGPHDQKDAERGQRPGEAQENKITERVGGA